FTATHCNIMICDYYQPSYLVVRRAYSVIAPTSRGRHEQLRPVPTSPDRRPPSTPAPAPLSPRRHVVLDGCLQGDGCRGQGGSARTVPARWPVRPLARRGGLSGVHLAGGVMNVATVSCW